MNNILPRINPEFKNLINPLSKEEYAQLEQNILAYKKCHDAIILRDGVIVDGHNRFEICVKHGIQFETKEMVFDSEEEVKLWIIENQLGRRNLTDAMRIELALSKTELLRQKAKENMSKGGGDQKSGLAKTTKQIEEPVNIRKAVAKNAGVGERTVHRYTQITKQGSPEFIEKVKSGELKINTAHHLLPAEILKQLKHADNMYRFIKKHVPIKGDENANIEIKARLAVLLGQIHTIMASRGADNADSTAN